MFLLIISLCSLHWIQGHPVRTTPTTLYVYLPLDPIVHSAHNNNIGDKACLETSASHSKWGVCVYLTGPLNSLLRPF